MTAKLTLGPVLFNWAPEKWRDFYFSIADEAPVDSVCVGEVVCAKRAALTDSVLPDVIARLEAGGKEILHSTGALIMNDDEMKRVRAIAAEPGHIVEANDISAVALLNGRPHAIGPFVNVYNEATLAYLAGLGATRVSLPAELPAGTLAVLAKSTPVELEVQVFGRLPLALSARCYHARSRNLHKDGCQYVCAEDPDGMEVKTLDGEPLFVVNGTQTLSYTYCNLLGELEALGAAGIGRFRLSPQDIDMVAVARIFRQVLDGREEPLAGFHRLGGLANPIPFSNGFYYGGEGVKLAGALAGADSSIIR